MQIRLPTHFRSCFAASSLAFPRWLYDTLLPLWFTIRSFYFLCFALFFFISLPSVSHSFASFISPSLSLSCSFGCLKLNLLINFDLYSSIFVNCFFLISQHKHIPSCLQFGRKSTYLPLCTWIFIFTNRFTVASAWFAYINNDNVHKP